MWWRRAIESYLQEKFSQAEGFQIYLPDFGEEFYLVKGKSPKGKEKVMFIQLSYGTCEVCDPFLALQEKYQGLSEEELIERAKEEVIRRATIEYDPMFFPEFGKESVLSFIEKRRGLGLTPVSGGENWVDEAEIRRFKIDNGKLIFVNEQENKVRERKRKRKRR